jgi:malate/lactate dehydrogenase
VDVCVHLSDDPWLQEGFISTVQQRGASIMRARGLSSALSAASSGVFMFTIFIAFFLNQKLNG